MTSHQTNSCEHYPATGVPRPHALPPRSEAWLLPAEDSQSEVFKKHKTHEEFKKLKNDAFKKRSRADSAESDSAQGKWWRKGPTTREEEVPCGYTANTLRCFCWIATCYYVTDVHCVCGSGRCLRSKFASREDESNIIGFLGIDPDGVWVGCTYYSLAELDHLAETNDDFFSATLPAYQGDESVEFDDYWYESESSEWEDPWLSYRNPEGATAGSGAIDLGASTSAAFLNGINGEATNTDDLDSIGLADLQRTRREAANRVHQRPGQARASHPRSSSGSSNAGEAFRRTRHARYSGSDRSSDRGQSHHGDSSDDEDNLAPAHSSVLVHVGYGMLADHGWVTDSSWYADPVYEVVPPGLHLVYRYGYGWAEIPVGKPDKKRVKMVHLEQFTRSYHVERCFDDDNNRLEGREYILPTAIVVMLDKVLRPIQMDAAALKTMLARSRQGIIGLPDYQVDEVVSYFIHRTRHALYVMNRALTCGINETKNPYAVLREVDYECQEDEEFAEVVKTRATSCLVDEPYPIKGCVTINGRRHEKTDHLAYSDVFRTLPQGRKRKHRTQMFSIEGERKFQHYDNSPENAVLALKRIVGAREGEAKYQRNQDLLHMALAEEIEAPRIDQACRQRVVYRPDGYRSEPGDLQNYVALKIKAVLERVDKHALDAAGYEYEVSPKGWLYYSMWDKYLTHLAPLYSRVEAAEIMHVKRALRRCYVRMAKYHTTDDLMVKRLEACVKNELAKPGKVPRLFVAYGAGSMYANELPEFVKMCLQPPMIVTENRETFCVRVFAKPKAEDINNVFSKAIADQLIPGLHHIMIYSDDSVYMGNSTTHGPYAYNVDISSCDSSNGPAIFSIVGRALAAFDEERALGLIEMCNLPIHLVNPDDPEDIATIKSDVPFEGSGTVLTTILNHFASLCIAFGFMYEYNNRKFTTEDYATDTSDHIKNGALGVGHKITIEDTYCVYEKLQFLKYSPLRTTTGQWLMTKNLGCLLRSLGKLDGDMTPAQLGMSLTEFNATPWLQRMKKYTAGVIQGYCHEPLNPILKALRDNFDVPTVPVESYQMVEVMDSSHLTIDTASLCVRYDIEPEQLEDFTEKLRWIKLGSVVVDDVATQVYQVDYSL